MLWETLTTNGFADLMEFFRFWELQNTVYVYSGTHPIYEGTYNTTDQTNLITPDKREISIRLGNMNVAKYVNGQLRYNLLDHLGSTRVVTDQAGNVLSSLDYETFDKRTAGDIEDASFTGKKEDAGTGLYYFNARYYDPTIGRFITLDPAKDGQNWYVYTHNNPLKWIDPNGLLAYGVNDNDEYQWTIENGDTLSSIAGETGFSIEEILEVNPNFLDPDLTFAGIAINIPQSERILAFQWAMQQEGSSHYAVWAWRSLAFYSGQVKCNLFVHDAYSKGAGVTNYPLRQGRFLTTPIPASALASGEVLGSLKPIAGALPGDIVSDGGHTGIVGLNGNYISASSRRNRVVITPTDTMVNGTPAFMRYQP